MRIFMKGAPSMKNRFQRTMTALTTAVVVISSTAITAHAATSDQLLDEMGQKVFSAYLIFRNISVFSVILSLAYFGFEILMSAFMSRADIDIDKIKKRIIYMVIALMCIVLLPSMVGWAKSIALPNAWTPPG